MRSRTSFGQASIFSGLYCENCPPRQRCQSVDTVEACGDPIEHPGEPHPSTAQLSQPSDFDMPIRGEWPSIPELPSSLVVASIGTGPVAQGVRLADCRKLVGAFRRGSTSRRGEGKIAVLFGSDAELAGLTANRGLVGRALAAAGFIAVVAPAYSTWRGDSPYVAQVSISRTARMAVELATSLPTIPSIVWRELGDMDTWDAWIRANGLGTVAMDLGTLRGEPYWNRAVDGIAHLNRLLLDRGAVPRLLVSGPSTLGRIADVGSAWAGQVVALSQSPWQLALHGKVLRADLFAETAPASMPFADLIAINSRQFCNAVNAA